MMQITTNEQGEEVVSVSELRTALLKWLDNENEMGPLRSWDENTSSLFFEGYLPEWMIELLRRKDGEHGALRIGIPR